VHDHPRAPPARTALEAFERQVTPADQSHCCAPCSRSPDSRSACAKTATTSPSPCRLLTCPASPQQPTPYPLSIHSRLWPAENPALVDALVPPVGFEPTLAPLKGRRDPGLITLSTCRYTPSKIAPSQASARIRHAGGRSGLRRSTVNAPLTPPRGPASPLVPGAYSSPAPSYRPLSSSCRVGGQGCRRHRGATAQPPLMRPVRRGRSGAEGATPIRFPVDGGAGGRAPPRPAGTADGRYCRGRGGCASAGHRHRGSPGPGLDERHPGNSSSRLLSA
jgi:hypothetical protein